jgi:hypothetical protein
MRLTARPQPFKNILYIETFGVKNTRPLHTSPCKDAMPEGDVNNGEGRLAFLASYSEISKELEGEILGRFPRVMSIIITFPLDEILFEGFLSTGFLFSARQDFLHVIVGYTIDHLR